MCVCVLWCGVVGWRKETRCGDGVKFTHTHAQEESCIHARANYVVKSVWGNEELGGENGGGVYVQR